MVTTVTRWECAEKNYTWVNSKITFDHVGHAYLALFQVVGFTPIFLLNSRPILKLCVTSVQQISLPFSSSTGDIRGLDGDHGGRCGRQGGRPAATV